MSTHEFTISGPWKLVELKTYLVHSKYKNMVVATPVTAALGGDSERGVISSRPEQATDRLLQITILIPPKIR